MLTNDVKAGENVLVKKKKKTLVCIHLSIALFGESEKQYKSLGLFYISKKFDLLIFFPSIQRI